MKDKCSECWKEYDFEELVNEEGNLYCDSCYDEYLSEQEEE